MKLCVHVWSAGLKADPNMDFVPRTVMIGGKVRATMLAKIIVFDWYIKKFGERDLLLCYKTVT